MSAVVHFTLNGRAVAVVAPGAKRLADVLRDDLGLKGTKIGCNAGDCGACTVLLDGEQICACMVPLAQAEGCAVESIEGLAGGGAEINALQAAFHRHGAAQQRQHLGPSRTRAGEAGQHGHCPGRLAARGYRDGDARDAGGLCGVRERAGGERWAGAGVPPQRRGGGCGPALRAAARGHGAVLVTNKTLFSWPTLSPDTNTAPPPGARSRAILATTSPHGGHRGMEHH